MASAACPDVEGDKPAKKKFKSYPIGYFHIDIAEVQTAEGKLYLFVAIDRTSKFAYVELHEKATQDDRGRVPAPPDRGRSLQHPYRPDRQRHPVHKPRAGPHCLASTSSSAPADENGIEHRLTKIKHPWTNGQVERMNRTIKEATVKRFHYDDHDQLDSTSPTSSPPTISAAGSRPSRASHPTSSSANSGQTSRNDSPSIQSIKCRD